MSAKNASSRRRASARVVIGLIVVCLSNSGHALVAGRWVNYPANGVATGKSGGLGPLAICRANDDGGQHAGKLWEGQCHYEWGYQNRVSWEFQVLLDDGFSWVNPFVMPPAGTLSNETAKVPANAIDGGDAGQRAHHVRLAVCQAYIPQDKTWHPGKFYAGHCNIAWGAAGEAARDKKRKQRMKRAPNPEGDVLILVK